MNADTLNAIRSNLQATKQHLSVFEPQTVFTAQVNDPTIARNARNVAYNNTSGNWQDIKPGMTLWVGTTPGSNNIGYLRIRSATSSSLSVAENGDVAWSNGLYLTVKKIWDIWAIYPRIIQSGAEDIVFYKDYDIEYSNQNSILGTLVCAGPHRAGFVGSSFVWSSTGTTNLRNSSLNYAWQFEGGNIATSTAANPPPITYNTPGHYVTTLTVTGSGGEVDTTYRYVSIYDRPGQGGNVPILKWSMEELEGSRDEGGYTTSFTVFENIDRIVDGAVVILFGESFYNGVKQSLNNNSSDVFFVGYVLGSTIRYDHKSSSVSFDVGSITEYMKVLEGFSISVETAAAATKWYEVDDLDWQRAIYHYLRWQTTVMLSTDIRWHGNNKKLQYYDADRESLYDALNSFLRSATLGRAVSDRQGVIWIENDAQSTPNFAQYVQPMFTVERRDWVGEPTISESIVNPVSFLEVSGIAYSGIVTGTYTPVIAGAPSQGTPAYRGTSQRISGLSVTNQDDISSIAGMLYKNRNARYPNVSMRMRGAYLPLDIAPQKSVTMAVQPADTNRRISVNGLYCVDALSYKYGPENESLQVNATYKVIETSYLVGESIPVPPVPEEAGYSQPEFIFPIIPAINLPTINPASTAHMLCIGSNTSVTLSPNTSNVIVSMADTLHGVGHVGYMSKSANTIVIGRQGLYHVSFAMDVATVFYNVPHAGEISVYITKQNDPYIGGGANPFSIKSVSFIQSNTLNILYFPGSFHGQGYMWCNIGDAIYCRWTNTTTNVTPTFITKMWVNYVGSGVISA